jgi:hypothetical protein
LGIQRTNAFVIETPKTLEKSITKHPNPLIQQLWTLDLEHPLNTPQNILLSTDSFPTKPKKIGIHPAIIHLDPHYPSIQTQNSNYPNHHSPLTQSTKIPSTA